MRIRTILLPLAGVVSLVLSTQAFALNPQPLPPRHINLTYSLPSHVIVPPCVHHPYTCV
jgi:hypothetical protein